MRFDLKCAHVMVMKDIAKKLILGGGRRGGERRKEAEAKAGAEAGAGAEAEAEAGAE